MTQVPSQRVVKSRLKGQVACYACTSFANDSNSQQSNDGSSSSTANLYQTLEKAGILIPKRVTKYVESYHPAVPTNYQMRLVFCPNTIMEPAACVKLNGWHNGNQ